MAFAGFTDVMFQIIDAVEPPPPGEDDMGDLEFIQGKVLAGDYFQVSGNINSSGNTIEYTVSNGRTAFLIEAKITMSTNPDASFHLNDGTTTTKDQIVAELKIDGATKSKGKIGMATAASGFSFDGGNGSGFGVNSESKFNVLGLSLVGNGSKKITIENVLDSGSGFAEMSGYLV